eukprot:12892993-Prorocentrum_lima.AAC.1
MNHRVVTEACDKCRSGGVQEAVQSFVADLAGAGTVPLDRLAIAMEMYEIACLGTGYGVPDA